MNFLNQFIKDEEEANKINIDELYDKKQQRDLNTLSTYNKILNRIHNKIKYISKLTISEKFCWFVIPEVVLGVPNFDHTSCTAYIISKLRENGFIVKYTHPNLLFISWAHHIPSYVRSEFKKKTGIAIDNKGFKLNENNEDESGTTKDSSGDINNLFVNNKSRSVQVKKDYKSIDNYKPSGIYNNDLFEKLGEKLKK